jgi:hypothetical protein
MGTYVLISIQLRLGIIAGGFRINLRICGSLHELSCNFGTTFARSPGQSCLARDLICDSQNFGIPGLAVLELPSLLRDTGDSQSELPDNIQIFCFNKSR